MGLTRLSLHKKLKDVTGIENRYYSPPNGFNLQYPCIVYSRVNNANQKADNSNYFKNKRYTITIITEDPDDCSSDLLIDGFDYCALDRVFCSDNLVHFVHTLFI